MKISLDARCNHCRAFVSDGTSDWTVVGMKEVPFVVKSHLPSDLLETNPITGYHATSNLVKEEKDAGVIEHAEAIFLAAQDAWQQRDILAARPYMSEAIFLAWMTQIEAMIKERRKNILEDLRITSIERYATIITRRYVNATLKIESVCRDYEIDELSGKIVFGSKAHKKFQEYWTFSRSIATSKTIDGLAKKRCPHCGASLSVNESGECRYCQVTVTSGEFDWVVSRITQDEEQAVDLTKLFSSVVNVSKFCSTIVMELVDRAGNKY